MQTYSIFNDDGNSLEGSSGESSDGLIGISSRRVLDVSIIPY